MVITSSNGTLIANETFVVSCGCGGLVPQMKRLVKQAGVDVPFLNSSISADVRRYIKQIGLNDRVPSLRKSKHAVIYNPHTEKFIDLLNAPNNKYVLENIRRLVNG